MRMLLAGLCVLATAWLPAIPAPPPSCEDIDGDGYFSRDGCGTTRDCNDASDAMYPGASELCNGYDDDCDGDIDEGCDTSCGMPRPIADPFYVEATGRAEWNVFWTGARWGLSWSLYDLTAPDPVHLILRESDGTAYDQIAVTDPEANVGSGSSTWTGTEFGFVFRDGRDGVLGNELYFARTDADGNKIGSDVRLTDRPETPDYPHVIWTGAEYAVIWKERRDGSRRMFFLRFDRDGTPLDTVREISDPTASVSRRTFNRGLVWTGDGFTVAWADERDGTDEIYVARLDADGNKIGTDTRLTTVSSDRRFAVVLVWTGARIGMLWTDERTGIGSQAYFRPLTASGAALGPERVAGDTGAVPNTSQEIGLTWTGSEFHALWFDSSAGSDSTTQMYLARLDPDGIKLGGDVAVEESEARSYPGSIAWDGSRLGIVHWEWGYVPTRHALSILRCCETGIDADLDASSECDDCDDLDDGVAPGFDEICDLKDNDCDGLVDEGFDGDGDGYTTCGGDCNDGDPSITGAWEIPCNGVDEDCDGLADDSADEDGDGRDICGPGDLVNPDGLAADCNDHLPGVHPNATEACFNAIDDDCDGYVDEGCAGTCEGVATPFASVQIDDPASTDATDANLHWTGDGFGTFWAEVFPDRLIHNTMFRRLSADGTLEQGSSRITDRIANQQGHPRSAWTGREYGLVRGEVSAQRIDEDGVPVGNARRIEGDIFSPSRMAWTGRSYGSIGGSFQPGESFAWLDGEARPIGDVVTVPGISLAWNGSEYGMVWTDDRDGNNEIYFTRIGEDGTSLGAELRLTNHSGPSAAPTIVWNGDGYGIAWVDRRIDVTGDIYFAEVDAMGTKLTADLPIVTQTAFLYAPQLAWTGTEYGLAWRDGRDSLLYETVYFVRLDSAGGILGTETRVSLTSANSVSLVWTGTEYGAVWHTNESDSRVLFRRIGCCGEDRDADTSGACDDCDDLNPDAFPGATEVCDFADNNCDGQIDEGFPTPGAVSGLAFTDSVSLAWDPDPVADRYDVIRGDLLALRSSGGNFATTGIVCVKNDATDAMADAVDGPLPGEGHYLLVRAQAACKDGSWQGSGEIGDRDGSILTAAGVCP